MNKQQQHAPSSFWGDEGSDTEDFGLDGVGTKDSGFVEVELGKEDSGFVEVELGKDDSGFVEAGLGTEDSVLVEAESGSITNAILSMFGCRGSGDAAPLFFLWSRRDFSSL